MATMIVAVLSNAAQGAVLLSDLINNNGQIVVGDLKFDQFSYAKVGDMPEADRINVATFTDANGNDGIRFQGAFIDLPGNGLSDGLIGYRVMGLNGIEITDAHLQANTVIVGGPGLIAVTETFLPEDDMASMNVFNQRPGPQQLVDWVYFEDDQGNPTSHPVLHVQKDIFALASGDFGAATISFIDQTFSIPEPASMALVGGGFALLLRRRRAA